jgi:cytoskeleton protein RodZ
MSNTANQHRQAENTNDWLPGAKLRSLREEANISLDVIAKGTLIPFAKLKLLEEDKYTEIGKEVFVIAYIRKYAKSLGISSDPFVEQFKRLSGSTLGSNIGEGLSITESTKDATFAIFDKIRGWQVVVVVVAVWLGSVFLYKSETPETFESSPSAAETHAIETHKEAVAQRTEKSEKAHSFSSSTTSDDESNNTVSSEEGSEQDSEAQIQGLTASDPDTGADILVFGFLGECWVKVWDARGEVIFAHIQNSGDNLRLSGDAPFTVMLGNARAVDLLVNGRRISTEPAEGKRTLRLSVGP